MFHHNCLSLWFVVYQMQSLLSLIRMKNQIGKKCIWTSHNIFWVGGVDDDDLIFHQFVLNQIKFFK